MYYNIHIVNSFTFYFNIYSNIFTYINLLLFIYVYIYTHIWYLLLIPIARCMVFPWLLLFCSNVQVLALTASPLSGRAPGKSWQPASEEDPKRHKLNGISMGKWKIHGKIHGNPWENDKLTMKDQVKNEWKCWVQQTLGISGILNMLILWSFVALCGGISTFLWTAKNHL